jgi:hypothetical protein
MGSGIILYKMIPDPIIQIRHKSWGEIMGSLYANFLKGLPKEPESMTPG